jgi:hypothetical protein
MENVFLVSIIMLTGMTGLPLGATISVILLRKA